MNIINYSKTASKDNLVHTAIVELEANEISLPVEKVAQKISCLKKYDPIGYGLYHPSLVHLKGKTYKVIWETAITANDLNS